MAGARPTSRARSALVPIVLAAVLVSLGTVVPQGGAAETTSQPEAVTSTLPKVPPGAPSKVVVRVEDSSAFITLHPPTSPNGLIIGSYEVTANPGGHRCTATRQDTKLAECTITGLTNGTSYTFEATATNAAGTGPPATSPPATPAAAPSDPQDVRIVPAEGSATVSWGSSHDAANLPISYALSVTDPAGHVDASCLTQLTTCTVAPLRNTVRYQFDLVASNGAAFSRNVRTWRTLASKPGAPTNVKVVGGTGVLKVSWTPPLDTGLAPITKYVATAKELNGTLGGTCYYTEGVDLGNWCQIAGLTDGFTYDVQVVAENVAGTSADATTQGSALVGPNANTVEKTLDLLFQGWDITPTKNSLTLTKELPAGQKIAGIGVSGSATIVITNGSNFVVTCTAQLPQLFGDASAQLDFSGDLSADGKSFKLSSLAVVGKDASISKLFTVDEVSLRWSNNLWEINGVVSTPDKKVSTLGGSLMFSDANKIVGGSLHFGGLSLAGLVDLTSFSLAFDPAVGWTGHLELAKTWNGKDDGNSGRVDLAFSPEGQLLSGEIDLSGQVALFKVIELSTFRLSYNASTQSWSVALGAAQHDKVVPVGADPGSISVALTVTNGAIESGGFEFTNFTLANTVGIKFAKFNFSSNGGNETFVAESEIALPGAAGTTVAGSLTFVNGSYLSGSLAATNLNIPIYGGVFLQSIQASLDIGSKTQPWKIGGGVSASIGPAVSGTTPLELGGSLAYTFPSDPTKLGTFDLAGWVTSAGITMGNATVEASLSGTHLRVVLGEGDGSEGFGYGGIVKLTGVLSGEVTPTRIGLTGKTELTIFVYKFSAEAALSQTGLAACGAFQEQSAGFVMPWGQWPTWVPQNCSLSGY